MTANRRRDLRYKVKKRTEWFDEKDDWNYSLVPRFLVFRCWFVPILKTKFLFLSGKLSVFIQAEKLIYLYNVLYDCSMPYKKQNHSIEYAALKNTAANSHPFRRAFFNG